jgi:hypothetical protein
VDAITLGSKRKLMDVSGKAGGPFNARGEGFGDAKGSLDFGGRLIDPTSWRDDVIKGMLPRDLKPCAVTVTRADGVEIQIGKFEG